MNPELEFGLTFDLEVFFKRTSTSDSDAEDEDEDDDDDADEDEDEDESPIPSRTVNAFLRDGNGFSAA
jgi:hypothetical protein